MTDSEIIINRRYCGPPDSGNGGYVCGRLAAFVKNPAEVILRKPPPLSKPMKVVINNERALLMDGEILIAEAKSGKIDAEAPDPPDFETAVAASKNYIGFENHVFPTCFVCGTKRTPPDGLQIFAGIVASAEKVAAPWIPDSSLADENGLVKSEFHWAALDCPGYFAITAKPGKSVLGKMTAEVFHRVKAGERCVVIGWLIKDDGRKHYTGTALYDENRILAAIAIGVWIDI